MEASQSENLIIVSVKDANASNKGFSKVLMYIQRKYSKRKMMNMSRMVVMRLARTGEGQLEGKAQARWRSHEVGR